jgi:symplekin
MTAVQIGPGFEASAKLERSTSTLKTEDDDYNDDGESSSSTGKISTLIGGTSSSFGAMAAADVKKKSEKTVTLLPAGFSSKKSIKKTLKLAEITKRLTSDETTRQMTKAVERVLKAERVAFVGGVSEERAKIITTLAARFPANLKTIVLEFLFEDLNKRIELAFSW